MRTVDLHADKENKDRIKYDLKINIDFAKREKDKLLCIIVGYGSKGGTHKIRNYVIEFLDEYLKTNYVKDYILGNDIDIFNPKYHSFKGRDLIPDSLKKSLNMGIILVLV